MSDKIDSELEIRNSVRKHMLNTLATSREILEDLRSTSSMTTRQLVGVTMIQLYGEMQALIYSFIDSTNEADQEEALNYFDTELDKLKQSFVEEDAFKYFGSGTKGEA
jgi:hypothetical protein